MPDTPTFDLAALLAAVPERGLRSFGYRREIDTGARTVTCIASTNKKARDGAIIDQRGWKLENYEKNPVVLWVHDDRQYPVAKTIQSSITDEALVQVHQFAGHGMANDVFDMIVGGYVNATSVRWWPLDARVDLVDGEETLVFTKQELLETSWVPVPADPHCLAVRADGSRFDLRELLVRAAAVPSSDDDPQPTEAPRADAALELAALTTRVDGLADSVSALTSVLERMIPDLALAARAPAPAPVPELASDDLAARLETALAPVVTALQQRLAAPARTFDPEAAAVAVLARLTGRSEDRIRAGLAGA